MRYIPKVHGGADAFEPYRRPPLDALPVDLRKILEEFDRLSAELDQASKDALAMSDVALDEQARVADRTAATAAARAGQPMPAAEHAALLAAARLDAKRRVEALTLAREDVVNEAHTIRWAHDGEEDRAKASAANAKRRTAVMVQAGKLADAIDAAVAERALADWYRTGAYAPQAATWIADVVPHAGISRDAAGPIAARVIITGTVNAVLEDEETP